MQPMQPMGMPQQMQPMGMPQQAQGIMASSQPLVDAIAADAANPAGGDTLSMAQGGLASEDLMARGYRHGGLHYGQNPNNLARALGSPRPRPNPVSPPPPPQMPVRQNIIDRYKKRNQDIAEDVNAAKDRFSSLSLPSIVQRTGEAGYRAPDSSSIMSINASGLEGSLTQGLDVAVSVVDPSLERKGIMRLSDLVKESYNETRERWMGSPPQGIRKPSESRVGALSKGFGSSVADAAGDIFNDLSNSLKSLFSSDFANKYPDMDFGMLASSIDRMQKAHPEFKDEISDLSENFIASNNSLLHSGLKESTNSAAINLQNLVLKSLSNKYEIATHQDRIINANDEAKAFLETDIGQGFASAEGGASDAAVDRSMGDLDTSGGLDTAAADRDLIYQSEFEEGRAQRQGENYPNLTADQLKTLALDASDEEGFEGAVIPGAATGPGAGPAKAAGTSPSEGGPQGLDEVIGGYNTAAAQATRILNTDKKADGKTIDDFKKKFMEAMPKYEGMSEEEKGFLIAEAGLRVMAGKSPNAIANIAKGLQGLGPALMKGAKEKRAWNRQVELSAAKYGLENVAKEEALAQSLAKEKRSLYNKIFVVQPNETIDWQGKIYSGGDRIVASTGSLQDGTFPINKVTTEAFSLEQIKRDAASLKAKTDRLFSKVEPPSKFVSSQIKYIEASSQIKANVAISNLLKEAVVPLQAGEVTGGINALKAFAQKIKNFTGLDIPYASEKPEEYRDKVGRAITANITSLLNEGNRTVSDADRTRAEQIGGLYADNLLAPSTKSANLLTEKLMAFEEAIQRNNSKNIGIMSGVENAWNGTLNNALVNYKDILVTSRGSLGSTAKRATPGSKRTVKWTDIISVNPDNPSVLDYKSDWFKK